MEKLPIANSGNGRLSGMSDCLLPYASAAAAKSLQSCPTLCRRQPTRLPHLQSRTLEWVAISFSNVWEWKVKVKSLSRVWPLVTPWTAAYKAPPSMGFSRQEYWSGLPLPSPPLCLIIPFPVLYLMLQSLPACWFPPAPLDIPAVMLPLSPNSWLLLTWARTLGKQSPHPSSYSLCSQLTMCPSMSSPGICTNLLPLSSLRCQMVVWWPLNSPW